MSPSKPSSNHSTLLAALVFVAAAASVALQTAQGPAAEQTTMLDGREVVAREVLVKFRGSRNRADRAQLVQQADSDHDDEIGGLGVRRIHSRTFDTAALLAFVRAQPNVAWAEPNYIVRASANVPNDPDFGLLWGLRNTGQPILGIPGVAGADIRAASAWDVSTGSTANVVAVIDTGIDYMHPDLAPNIWSAAAPFQVTIGGVTITCAAGTHGFNAITRTCDPRDDNNHGSHVAGTIGAAGNNGLGVVGVNWTASIMAIKFLNASGTGTTADAIDAIEFAIQAKSKAGANVRVLSNSWGGDGSPQALLDEINKANANDMLFVAAAGNNDSNNDVFPFYPASFAAPNIVAVAASDNQDQLASFSNYGPTKVHLGAPGVNVWSTIVGGAYQYLNGTSMATPHVAGAALLVLSRCALDTAALKSNLLNNVDATLTGWVSSGGRLNVDKAIRACTPASATVGAAAVNAGASATVTIAGAPGAPGNTSDWVGLYPTAAADTGYIDWRYLNGLRTVPAIGLTSATLTFTMPATAGTYNFRLFANNSFTKLATSNAVTVLPPPPATVTPASTTVNPGGMITFTVANGPGNPTDWVALYASGAADGAYIAWTFLNGSTTPPASGVTGATLQLRAPTMPGAYELRWFANNTFSKLATSSAITVLPPPPATVTPASTAVNPGGMITFTVANGPGNPTDWVALYATGAANGAYMAWTFLNGSTTPPASGVTGATLQLRAPTMPGAYELRWFANNSFTRLATSSAITVLPPPAATVTLASTTVSPGGLITFTVANGPGNPLDWVALYATGASDGAYIAWTFLNGSTTPPASGLTGATLHLMAPAMLGTYELRWFANNSFTRLATSSAITVH